MQKSVAKGLMDDFQNLKIWYDDWDIGLFKLGFADLAIDEKAHIINNQILRILNVDATNLALDGGKHMHQ